MTGRRLTTADRQEIARERAKGVPAQDLAARFGVSRRTISATVRHVETKAAIAGGSLPVLSLRVSPEEMRAFDAAVSRFGLTRSEAMRRMMRAAAGLLALDGEDGEEVRQLRAAVNRVGGNVNQIARSCNEARLRGQPIPYTARTHAEVREAAAMIFEASNQMRALAQPRRSRRELAVGSAFGESDAAS